MGIFQLAGRDITSKQIELVTGKIANIFEN
jgi:hypothetical protein